MADDIEYTEDIDEAQDGDGANGEGDFEEEALDEGYGAGARGDFDADAATNGIVKMQARARGMLTRKHDLQDLAQASSVTKAEARAERRAALGKPLDEDVHDGQEAAPDGDGANGEGDFEEEALDEGYGAGARGDFDADAATNGIVKMQARARGMLTRKHDLQDLAQASSVTKAEARAERRAALGKPLDEVAHDGQEAAPDGDGASCVKGEVARRHVGQSDAAGGVEGFMDSAHQHSVHSPQSHFIASQPSPSKSSSHRVAFKAHTPDYEDLEGAQRSPEPPISVPRHPPSVSSNLDRPSAEHKKQSEAPASHASPRSSLGIAAPASFSFNASAAPGDPVSQALLKKLFAIEQSVSLLQSQIVKCLAADDASVYDQLHSANSQVEKLMRIRSEILVALQHQQQMASSSPKVAGASSSNLTPHKNNSLSPLSHSSKAKHPPAPPPAPMEYSYMSDNASSATFSASSRTNGDFSSVVSHSPGPSSSEEM